ncbi:MAG: 3-methyl-2-oxobutanoate hydroxymethyltransferase, partial [Candidatus Margulisiibacteriota bacterium]
FALVLEMVEESLAKEITKAIKIPTIGIGSGRNVDGQVLVTADLLGLYKNPPSFVEKYVDLRKIIGAAVRKFVRQNR